jgi:hypothetical protein
MMTLPALLALGVMTLASEPVDGASDPPTVITFDDLEVGRTPNGFAAALTGGGGPVAWAVGRDPGAPSGDRVLIQTSVDTTSSRFPLCIYQPVALADVTLRVKFKAISGTVDQAAGLVWRFRNEGNYYVVRANALEGNVVLYKVENGKRSDIKPLGSGVFAYGRKAEIAQGRWHALEVEARGRRFRVALDGERLFEVEDSTFPTPGKVGLWTKADSVTAFDDFVIQSGDAQ